MALKAGRVGVLPSEVDTNGKIKGGGSSPYVLPVASSSTLGGIKVGDGLKIDSSGVLKVTGGSEVGLSYADFSFTKTVASGSYGAYPFQPTSDMIGKRIISARMVSCSENPYGCVIDVVRGSDPVATGDWLYALLYAPTEHSGSITSGTFRVFYQ